MDEAAELRKQLEFASRLAKNHIQFVCLPLEVLSVVMSKESVEKLKGITNRMADVEVGI